VVQTRKTSNSISRAVKSNKQIVEKYENGIITGNKEKKLTFADLRKSFKLDHLDFKDDQT